MPQVPRFVSDVVFMSSGDRLQGTVGPMLSDHGICTSVNAAKIDTIFKEV